RKLSLDYCVLATSLSSHGDIRKEYRHTLCVRLFRLVHAWRFGARKGRNSGRIYLRGNPIIYIVACPSNCRHSFRCYTSSRESSIILKLFRTAFSLSIVFHLNLGFIVTSYSLRDHPDLTISPTRTSVGCGACIYSSGTSTSKARRSAIAFPI